MLEAAKVQGGMQTHQLFYGVERDVTSNHPWV